MSFGMMVGGVSTTYLSEYLERLYRRRKPTGVRAVSLKMPPLALARHAAEPLAVPWATLGEDRCAAGVDRPCG